MKKILILFFVSISLLGYAQYFQLTDPKGSPFYDGQTILRTITEEDLNAIDSTYAIEIVVVNLTATELDIKTSRTNITLVEGMSAYVCFGVCHEEDIYDINYTVIENSEPYSLHLKPNGNIGQCKFQIDFTAESQSITLYIEIDMLPLGAKENNNDNVFLNAYPNPVSVGLKVNVSYFIEDYHKIQNLVIRNIIGTEVIRMPLNPFDNIITFDTSSLKAGIYFYAIENNNQIYFSKKLIVK
jgi:hypothetical protein